MTQCMFTAAETCGVTDVAFDRSSLVASAHLPDVQANYRCTIEVPCSKPDTVQVQTLMSAQSRSGQIKAARTLVKAILQQAKTVKI